MFGPGLGSIFYANPASKPLPGWYRSNFHRFCTFSADAYRVCKNLSLPSGSTEQQQSLPTRRTYALFIENSLFRFSRHGRTSISCINLESIIMNDMHDSLSGSLVNRILLPSLFLSNDYLLSSESSPPYLFLLSARRSRNNQTEPTTLGMMHTSPDDDDCRRSRPPALPCSTGSNP